MGEVDGSVGDEKTGRESTQVFRWGLAEELSAAGRWSGVRTEGLLMG